MLIIIHAFIMSYTTLSSSGWAVVLAKKREQKKEQDVDGLRLAAMHMSSETHESATETPNSKPARAHVGAGAAATASPQAVAHAALLLDADLPGELPGTAAPAPAARGESTLLCGQQIGCAQPSWAAVMQRLPLGLAGGCMRGPGIPV